MSIFKNIFFYGLIGMTLVWSACEDCDDYDCSSGPYYGDLRVWVTTNEENPTVEVTIFSGTVESQDTVWSGIASDSKFTVSEVRSGKYYSGTALYKDGFKEIIAINGRTLDTKESDFDCSCVDGGQAIINLRLAK